MVTSSIVNECAGAAIVVIQRRRQAPAALILTRERCRSTSVYQLYGVLGADIEQCIDDATCADLARRCFSQYLRDADRPFLPDNQQISASHLFQKSSAGLANMSPREISTYSLSKIVTD